MLIAAFEQGGVRTLVEFTAPVFWFFLTLVGIGFFVLRQRFPQAPRPFKVPLYPLLPLAFVVTCGYLFYSSVTYAQSKNAIQVSFWVMGIGVIAWIAARLKKS